MYAVQTYGPVVGWGMVILLTVIVAGWLAHLAGQSPALGLVALIPVAGLLIFAVLVISRRGRAMRNERAARWAEEERVK
ncbi:hypothetical protein [Jannaschia aquimarina]|uniref:Uncharacterized protein n=1 Tax=Jannaschia aquimarina TaxID=935700 RepID=A0A0D1EDR8_9RHOB|nr:hypothetical protein [Jannaschia aquimarina]KIT15819.1 hypothetical protein jaqu_23990 [Jannaschia aquimarina]SNT09340.1 hypothetical protein SAMN05421775_105214 [Jannaschia aquimarina]